jgi:hypothetical protein
MAAESATPVFSNVRPMTASDLPAIARLDRVAFRVERRHVLEWVLDRAPEYCQVLVEEREIAGYCFGRHGRLFDQIGPIVAPGEAPAKDLAAAALNAAGGRALGALLTVDRPRDLGQGRRLIERGTALDPARAADPAVPLKAAAR